MIGRKALPNETVTREGNGWIERHRGGGYEESGRAGDMSDWSFAVHGLKSQVRGGKHDEAETWLY